MKLFNKPSGKTTVEKILREKQYFQPKVSIMLPALLKMKGYIDNSSTEIAWLGLVTKTSDGYLIEDVDLMKQEVSGHTAEIHESGLQEYAERLIADNRIDDLNKIKAWGHSHVNMGVTPSATDESTFKEYYKNCDYFIRIIGNKKGDMKVDMVETDTELRFDNVEWDIIYPQEVIKLVEKKTEVEVEVEKIEKLIEKSYADMYKKIEAGVKSDINRYVKEDRYSKNLSVFQTNHYNMYNEKDDWHYYGSYYDDYDDYYSKKNDIPTIVIYPHTPTVESIGIDELFSDEEIVELFENDYKAPELNILLGHYSQFESYKDVDWDNLYDAVQDYYLELDGDYYLSGGEINQMEENA